MAAVAMAARSAGAARVLGRIHLCSAERSTWCAARAPDPPGQRSGLDEHLAIRRRSHRNRRTGLDGRRHRQADGFAYAGVRYRCPRGGVVPARAAERRVDRVTDAFTLTEG